MAKNRRKKLDEHVVLEKEYQSILPLAQLFCTEVTHQIDDLLRRANVALSFPTQYRVKSWSSTREKLERLGLSIKHITDLQDLVGFRLILQFMRDVPAITDLMARTFTVVNLYDTRERLREDQFGYASVHLVVELPPAWLALPSLSDMKDIKAEIQIRTTAQHNWAAASHYLQYKTEESVPAPVRRAIYRVSALLETVDLELERVLDARERYKADAEHQPDEPLNVDLLEEVLDTTWPKANKHPGGEDYARLLAQISHFGVTTRAKLEKVLQKHRAAALQEEAEEVRRYQTRTSASKRVRAGVYFRHTGLTRRALAREFGDEWDKFVTAQYEAQVARKKLNAF
jgi:putative GTP pyrophosphokinase